MNNWNKMKEDITEIRKQAVRFKLKDFVVFIKIDADKDTDEALYYKEGIGDAIKKLVKCEVMFIDSNYICGGSIPAATSNGAYFMYPITYIK